jgi:hypothetical protein
MTAPIEDAGDSSPLAPPVEGSNETQHASLAEALERSSVLLDALNLSDGPSESPSGISPTLNPALLRRHRRTDEADEAKEDTDLQQEMTSTDATPTTTGTSAKMVDQQVLAVHT